MYEPHVHNFENGTLHGIITIQPDSPTRMHLCCTNTETALLFLNATMHFTILGTKCVFIYLFLVIYKIARWI